MPPTKLKDGRLYHGQWTLDLEAREGFGMLLSALGDQMYEGYFKDNHMNGHGRIIFSDGLIQEGQFVAGKLNGLCKVI